MIRGKGIYLRTVQESDLEQLRQWRNSPEVANFMLSRSLITPEQQANWFRNIRNDPSSFYWMILTNENKKLGLASLTKIDNTEHSAEPGLYIGDAANRNSFFGLEAYYQVLHFAFDELGVEKIYGTTLAENQPAHKMNLSFGFKQEALIKDGLEVGGLLHDLYKVILYKADFYNSRLARFFAAH